jgi:hypothetical protein
MTEVKEEGRSRTQLLDDNIGSLMWMLKIEEDRFDSLSIEHKE